MLEFVPDETDSVSNQLERLLLGAVGPDGLDMEQIKQVLLAELVRLLNDRVLEQINIVGEGEREATKAGAMRHPLATFLAHAARFA